MSFTVTIISKYNFKHDIMDLTVGADPDVGSCRGLTYGTYIGNPQSRRLSQWFDMGVMGTPAKIEHCEKTHNYSINKYFLNNNYNNDN